MVTRKKINRKFALISVYEKKNLKYLCTNLEKFDYKFISSGSTGKKIRSMGFKCIEVSKLTKFKEMLKFPKIDIVVVNLYPFKKISKKKKEQEIIEMIDIGGPSLLRAASKNYKYVTPILNTKDYSGLIKNLKHNNGETDINFRKNMASKIFKETSKYDEIIYRWFLEK